jgi:FkbM family methyltransferase
MLYDVDFLTTPKRLVFYGAGRYARDFCAEHVGKNIRVPDYVVDNNPRRWGERFGGAEICNPDLLLKEDPNETVVVLTTSPFNCGEIRQSFYYFDVWPAESLAMRFCLADRADWFDVYSTFADDRSRRVFETMTYSQASGQVIFRDVYTSRPYFGNDVVPSLPDGEVYVDAGAYTGDHIAAFAKLNPRFTSAYAFEPQPEHLWEVAKRFGHDPRVKLVSKGLYSSNGRIGFDAALPVGAHVVAGGADIEVVRLDDAVTERVTYIKMDIEGAEIEALKGCERTIAEHRPRLAISVYHRPSDYFEIPKLVHAMRQDYRLYLRQHSPFNVDTVLYAI